MVTVKEKTLLLCRKGTGVRTSSSCHPAGPVAPALFPVTAEPAAFPLEAPAVIAVPVTTVAAANRRFCAGDADHRNIPACPCPREH